MPGRAEERTHFIERNDRLWIGEHPLVPGLDFVVAIPMGSVSPLSVGSHTASSRGSSTGCIATA
jgi:hypothetical protein